MTQVSRGNRPGVALPIRIHDLLLSLAGRLDDDALADARQMLASAELDRSLEFVAGCLVAGRVVLANAQRHELESLFADTYLDPSVIDRVVARDPAPAARHRFAVGAVEGREPDRGVADAIRPVLDVLPDVRSVWCVWRLTPAGPVSGPVPHRVVLVGVGPGGFAPATAYRVEYALRRAGVRASVEVLVDGNQSTEYHQEAMRCARQVPFVEPDSGNRPRMSPARPNRAESFESPRVAAPAPFGGQRHDQPAPAGAFFEARADAAPAEPRRALPAPAELHAPAAERTLPPPVELPRTVPVEPRGADEFPPPIELRREPDGGPTPPRGSVAPPVELRRVEAPGDRVPPPADDLPRPELRPVPPPVELRAADDPSFELGSGLPHALELAGPEPLPEPLPGPRSVEPRRPRPAPRPRPEPAESASPFAQERLPEEPDDMPDELPPSALSIQTPTNSRPSPRRRNKPKDATRPRLVPANKDSHAAAFGDDILNTQERNLLRELQDELARREKQEQGSTSSAAWSGRHGRPGFDPARASGAPTLINGVPRQDGRGHPPAT